MVYAVILGILFGAGCLATGGIAIWGALDEGTVRKCVGGILCPILFILFLCIPFSFHQIDSGEVAVVKHMGTVSNVRTAGTYFDFWMTEKYERYDAKVQNMDIVSSAYSSDGQTMDIAMTVQYSIDQDKVKDIAVQYGTLDAVANKLEKVVIERTKAVLSKQSAMKIIETRATVSPAVEAEVKAAVDSSYYVTVNTVVLTNIDFTDAFEATVEQKMIAEQQKLQAQYENEKAVEKAKADLEIAKQQAAAKLAAAEADAQAQERVAEAEAKAVKVKSVEVARMLGFTITEAGEIDFDSVTDKDKINLISEYLKYIEYLAKWDGTLPDVVGDGALGMLPVEP